VRFLGLLFGVLAIALSVTAHAAISECLLDTAGTLTTSASAIAQGGNGSDRVQRQSLELSNALRLPAIVKIALQWA
jgi:hypothetical protein